MSGHSQEPYKIDELAELVHPRDGHRKVFTMIEAYLDESGIHDGAPVCIIAGYYGGKSQLKKLEVGWRRVLDDYGFSLEKFHAKDLIKVPKYRPMLESLARVIRGVRKAYPIVCGVVVDDFNSYSMDQRRFLTGATLDPRSKKFLSTGCPGKPYFVPFQQVVRLVCDMAPVGSRAHFIFGVDRPFAEYALALFKQVEEQAKTQTERPWSKWNSMDRLGTALFPRASETAQLQAADLLAHLTYLQMREWLARATVLKPSALLADCLANASIRPVYQDRECLDKMLSQSRKIVWGWDTLSAKNP